MKYAFTSFSCPDMSLEGMVALAGRFGYDGIELRVGYGHGHGIELDITDDQIAASRNTLAANDIELCCLGCACKFSNPATADDVVKTTLAYLDLAAALGTPVLRVFGGLIPEGVNPKDAFALLERSLSLVVDHAARRGVCVCIETHDDWSDPALIAELMGRLDHPAAGVVWDVMHPVRELGWTMSDSFSTLKPWIKLVHVHDGLDQPGRIEFRPTGDGDFDHREVIRVLEAASYSGYVSGEWIDWADPCDVHLPREIATLRSYES